MSIVSVSRDPLVNLLGEAGEVRDSYRSQQFVFFLCQQEALPQISKADSLKWIFEKLAAECLVNDRCSDQAVKLLVFHNLFFPM
jgi:hypothetical protein